MNWAALAIGVGVGVAGIVAIGAARRTGTRAGLALAVPLLIVVTLNGAAPVRGALDPGYMGYAFGLLRAAMGPAVTAIAGPLVLACAAAAYLAATRRAGPGLLFVAGVCAALTVILGVPFVEQAVVDPADNIIQLGEYLTIPGLAATVLLIGILVMPFAAGTVWATRRGLSR